MPPESSRAAAFQRLNGPPEALFRVGCIGGDDERSVGTMRTGPWTLGPDGRPAAGSIGVLVDDMFGSCVLVHRPPGHWAVTIEMTIDFCAELPSDGSELRAESSAAHVDAGGGLGRGSVSDATGQVVAVGTQRLRFVPGTPPDPTTRPAPAEQPAAADATMLELLGARADGARTLRVPLGPTHANPMGNLHGGLVLALCDAAAEQAVRSDDDPLTTASINVGYLRPGPVSGTMSFVAAPVHRGRSLAVVQVEAIRPDGKLCAVARVTCHRSRL